MVHEFHEHENVENKHYYYKKKDKTNKVICFDFSFFFIYISSFNALVYENCSLLYSNNICVFFLMPKKKKNLFR